MDPHRPNAAARHRHNLDQVIAAGFDWIIDEELEGILSATGLDNRSIADIAIILEECTSPQVYDFAEPEAMRLVASRYS